MKQEQPSERFWRKIIQKLIDFIIRDAERSLLRRNSMELNELIDITADNPSLWVKWFLASEYPELSHYRGPNPELF